MSDKQLEELWNRAREIYLATTVDPAEKGRAERYFSSVRRVERRGEGLVVILASSFAQNIFANEIAGKVRKVLELAGAGNNLDITYEVGEAGAYEKPLPQPSDPAPKAAPAPAAATFNYSTMPLNPEYTFAEFVKGPSNSWAYASARGVAEKPGAKEYNPLFIHGGTGLGKTHLMQAIGNELIYRHANLKLCYLSTETFMNEYMNALEKHTIDQFRSKYRSMDVLLMDDVQFMVSKNNLQEEFFNTFNALQNAGKQIVMTSDVAPKYLPALEPRLMSRFEGGMVQSIEAPGLETRLAILRKKTENYRNRIPELAITFIAENIRSHVRAMEGALSRVKMMVDSDPDFVKSINLDMLHKHLQDLVEKERKIKKTTCEEIIEVVCDKFGITIPQILSKERTMELVVPRQMAMFISHKFTPLGLKVIAPKFNKTHATILNGVKQFQKQMDVDPNLRASLNEVLERLGFTMNDIKD